MKQMVDLNNEMKGFFASLYAGQDKPLVFGEGKEKAPVLALIGEAPGENEVLEGRPFVGKAGKNLNEFLDVLQLDRKDIYVTNVVKIRPFELGKTGRTKNRPPNKEELLLFEPFLKKELSYVQPKCLVSLGNVPLKALYEDKKITIGQVHGKVLQSVLHIPLFALYHPASIIYRRELKEVYMEDLKQLSNYLKTLG